MPEGMYIVQTSLRFEQSSSKLPSNIAEGSEPPSMKEAITIIVVNKKRSLKLCIFHRYSQKVELLRKWNPSSLITQNSTYSLNIEY